MNSGQHCLLERGGKASPKVQWSTVFVKKGGKASPNKQCSALFVKIDT